MQNNIYNRKTKSVEPEKIYKSRVMNFYYKTMLGGICRAFIRLPVVSKIYGLFQKRKHSTKNIEKFINDYNIDMSGFEGTYQSFNGFFIRKRAVDSFNKNPDCLITPAEACVLAHTIENGAIYSVKDKMYTLSKFLKDKKLACEYEGGIFLIFRLRVYDYHRFCFVDDGQIISSKRIRGFLDSVNIKATGKFTLSSNYRTISHLKTANFGDIVVSEVGAMLVGQIAQTHTAARFLKGGEKGYFEFGGSTIVMLIKKDTVQIDEDIMENSLNGIETKIDFGERVGIRIGGAGYGCH